MINRVSYCEILSKPSAILFYKNFATSYEKYWDCFIMMRTHYCGVCHRKLKRSNHHYLRLRTSPWPRWVFLDMRDREGLQVVIDPDTPEAIATADSARSEYVLKNHRPCASALCWYWTQNMTSGQVELLAKDIETIATSETPPFPSMMSLPTFLKNCA